MIKFIKKEPGLGVVRFEELGVKGEGLSISGSGSGVLLSGCSSFIKTKEDLEEMAKAVSYAFQFFERIKRSREVPEDPGPEADPV